MIRASQVEPTQVELAYHGRVPFGQLTVISGRPGEGKSTLTCDIVAEFSQQAPVFFSNQEDPIDSVVVPRLQAAGAVMKRVFFPTDVKFPGGIPMLPRDVALLEKFAKQTGCKLFVFDAAVQHLQVKAFDNQGARQAVTPLKAMLERTGCACVFVDHLKKSPPKGGHPLEALAGGGSGIVAAARFVYVFGTNPEDDEERVLAPVKVNTVRADSVMRFAFDSVDVRLDHSAKARARGKLTMDVGRLLVVAEHDQRLSAKDVIAYSGKKGNAEHGNLSKRAVAAEFLTTLLMWGPKSAEDIRQEGADCGLSLMTLKRASQEIGIVKIRKGFGKGSAMWWELPPGHPALAVAASAKQEDEDDEPTEDDLVAELNAAIENVTEGDPEGAVAGDGDE